MDDRAAPASFADDYRDALHRFMAADASEPAREDAYELGRRALADGRSILDLASLHQHTLCNVLLQGGTLSAASPTAEIGSQFFAEVMAPFEMAHRGYADTIQLLKQANATLEQRVKERTHELQESERRVARLARIYAILSGINSAIVRLRNRDELLAEACRVAVRHGGFAMAWVGLCSEVEQLLEPAAWCARDEGDIRAVVDALLNDVPGMISKVLSGGGPQVDHLAPSGTGKGPCPRVQGCRAFALLPLQQGNRITGIFALYSGEADIFDPEEMRLLDELAGDIGFGLEQIRIENQLSYVANYDSLTALPNDTLLLERLARELMAAQRDARNVALLLLDLERFSHINDTFGRHVGDELLRQVAERLRVATREDGDTVARVSSDQFAVILANLADATQMAHKLDNHVLESLRPPFHVGGSEIRLAAKVGISFYPSDADDAEGLYKNAEIALKRAQEEGQRYLLYDAAMNRRIVRSVTLETKLRRAIERDELLLHYQPKVATDTGRLAGLEALVRFQDPESGKVIMPSQFVPLLEETGLILDAGVWVVQRAAADRRRWMDQGLAPPRVAVNVSPIQLRDREFMPALTAVSRDTDQASFGLDIELTESAVMQEVEENIPKLEAARDLGYRVVIDDFGTGYSSLSYLSRLPVNALKIDRSFIVTMAESPRSLALVTTIISLAHSLGMEVIAEGVEAEEQAKLLRLLRCEQIQGYLYSRPLPPEGVAEMLRAGKAG